MASKILSTASIFRHTKNRYFEGRTLDLNEALDIPADDEASKKEEPTHGPDDDEPKEVPSEIQEIIEMKEENRTADQNIQLAEWQQEVEEFGSSKKNSADAEKEEAEAETKRKEELDKMTEDDRKKAEEEDKEKGKEVDWDLVFKSEDLAQFELKDKEELIEVVNDYSVVLGENEKLETKVTDLEKQLKTKEPEFTNPLQKKAFEFIQRVKDPKDFGTSLQNYAQLMDLDPAKIDDRTALKELYVLDNPEISRDKAIRLFDKQKWPQYVAVNPDDVEEPDPEDVEDKKLLLERDAAKAKTELGSLQEKYKAEPAKEEESESKEEKQAREAKEEAVTTAIAADIKDLEDKVYKDFDALVVEVDEKDPENDFVFKLNSKQVAQIREIHENILKNAGNRGDDGKLPEAYDAEAQKLDITFMLFGAEMAPEFIKHGKTLGTIKEVEAKSEKTPDRKETVPGAKDVEDMEAQFEVMAEKKRKARLEKEGYTVKETA